MILCTYSHKLTHILLHTHARCAHTLVHTCEIPPPVPQHAQSALDKKLITEADIDEHLKVTRVRVVIDLSNYWHMKTSKN